MPEPIRCPIKNCLEIEKDGKTFGTYVATVPPEHTLDAVMAPEYFGKMQARGPTDKLLRNGDFIDVRPADNSWYVRLMVRACFKDVDKVLTAAIVPAVYFDVGDLPDDWSMEYMGHERKWTVFYNDSEKAALFKTPEEAKAKIDELAAQPDAPVAPRRKSGPKPKTAATAPAKEPEPA